MAGDQRGRAATVGGRFVAGRTPDRRRGGFCLLARSASCWRRTRRHGAVRLVDPDTGREYARLENPNQDRAFFLSFSPDGTQLVTTKGDSQSIHVWDLRPSGSGWPKWAWTGTCPTYAPAPEVNKSQPLQIQVDLGSLALLVRDEKQITRQLIEQKHRALEANPNDARACNELAWTYLIAPEALRDWKAALPVAQKAVQLVPDAMNRNTLGLAYYRAGRYREAVETLEPNLKDQVNWALTYDLYFLAMSHHQLGESGRAREFYDLAVRWSGATTRRSTRMWWNCLPSGPKRRNCWE